FALLLPSSRPCGARAMGVGGARACPPFAGLTVRKIAHLRSMVVPCGRQHSCWCRDSHRVGWTHTWVCMGGPYFPCATHPGIGRSCRRAVVQRPATPQHDRRRPSCACVALARTTHRYAAKADDSLAPRRIHNPRRRDGGARGLECGALGHGGRLLILRQDRKSTRLNSSHVSISYAVFCLK